MVAPRSNLLGVGAALGVASFVSLAAVAPALAADPSPNPAFIFDAPVELVWMDNHGTYNGPVTDNEYMLVPPGVEVAGEPGHYKLADGSGGVYHYFGHDVSGPYTDARDLCPFMAEKQIDLLYAWPWGDRGISLTECAALNATPTPAATPLPTPAESAGGGLGPVSPWAPGWPPGGSGPGGGVPVVPLAVAGVIIAGGVLGLNEIRKPKKPAASQHSAQNNDPCAAELTAEAIASAYARGINSVLATLRDFYANLQQQIVLLEDAAIPTEIGVETAFMAGSALGGKVGIGLVPETILGKIFEGVAKDQLKGLIKTSFKNAAVSVPGGAGAAIAARDAAAKAALKGLIKDSLSDHYLAQSTMGYHRGMDVLARSLPGKFKAADEIAGHMADSVDRLLTLYSTGMNLATLVQESSIMREKAMAIYGDIADLQEEFNSALERQAEAAGNLNRCRWVHSPTKEPLHPGGDPTIRSEV